MVEAFFFAADFDGGVEEVELLAGGIVGEAEDAEADEAYGLFEGDFGEEGLGHGLKFFFDAGGAGEGALAGEGGEVFPAELEAPAGGETAVGAEAAGDFFDEFEEDVFDARAGAFVVEEGVFAGEGFFADVEFDFAGVVAEGEGLEMGGAVCADDAWEEGEGEVPVRCR